MKDNSSETNDGTISDRERVLIGGGGMVGIVAFMFSIIYYGVTLIILASLVTLGSIALGVFLILRSSEGGDAVFRAVSGEIEQLSNDASFDIAEELIVWDKLKYTKGIGTRIAGQDGVIEDIYRRLANAREELAQADTPVHRIEAVLAVDSVLAIAKEVRTSA